MRKQIEKRNPNMLFKNYDTIKRLDKFIYQKNQMLILYTIEDMSNKNLRQKLEI